MVFSVIFLMLLLYVSYDISTRTTFPGSKPRVNENTINHDPHPDSLSADSLDKETQKRIVR